MLLETGQGNPAFSFSVNRKTDTIYVKHITDTAAELHAKTFEPKSNKSLHLTVYTDSISYYYI